MRKQAFKPTTVRNSFKAVGLIPYNPDVVILPRMEKLHRQKSESPPATPSDCSTITWPTPQKPIEFQDYADYLEAHIKPAEDEQLNRRWERFVKGAVAKSISGQEAEQLLRAHKKAAALHHQRQDGSKKIIGGGGVLYADEARQKIEDRRRKDVEVAEDHIKAQNLPRGTRGKFKRAQAKKRELERLRQFEHPERANKRLKRAQSV